MVESQVVSVTPATHADQHRNGGSDPLTGDVRINKLSSPVYSGASVYSGAGSNTAWVDLDLSAIIGAKETLVILGFDQTVADTHGALRTNGDVMDYYIGTVNDAGAGSGYFTTSGVTVLVTMSDAAGIVEWISAGVNNIEIFLIAYLEV